MSSSYREVHTWAAFSKALKDIAAETEEDFDDFYDMVVHLTMQSIKYGSPLTGAPGQPVKSGDLLASWESRGSSKAKFVLIVSELIYAIIIELNTRGAQLRSKVGGFHSVELTYLGFDEIIRQAVSAVAGRIARQEARGRWRDITTGRFTRPINA